MILYRDRVVVGASAGGVEALRELVAGLPANLPAAVLVTMHMPATGAGALPRILHRSGPLPADHARPGGTLRPGRIYVAVPDHHLLIHKDMAVLSRSARQNRVRPAVDALFRSAARWCGSRAIGVVLSGALDDGAAGLATISGQGGAGAVQDPAEALFSGMPTAALAAVPDAVVASAGELSGRLVDLIAEPVEDGGHVPDRDLILETDMAEHTHTPGDGERPGRPVQLGCPECTGGMSQVDRGNTTYYRCHVGHSYSPQTLIVAQREKIEMSLWTAVSMMEEQATVHRHLAARAADHGAITSAEDQDAAAVDVLDTAATVRQHITGPTDSADELRP